MIGSLQTVGFIHSGLASIMVLVHGPTEYTIRVTMHKTVEISNYIENYGATILPSMLSAGLFKELMNWVLQLFTSLSEEAEKRDFFLKIR